MIAAAIEACEILNELNPWILRNGAHADEAQDGAIKAHDRLVRGIKEAISDDRVQRAMTEAFPPVEMLGLVKDKD